MTRCIFVLIIVLGLIFFSCGTEPQQQSSGQAEAPLSTSTYLGKKLNRFDKAIENMEKEDSTRVVQKGEVLFTGSSSIRMWNTLIADMHPIPVINRGFGGSMIPEVIHYADRMVFPYKPEFIVFYCGENDISEGAAPQEVFASFKKFDQIIQNRLPGSQMIFISMKPSLARWGLWDRYVEGNALIRDYIKSKPHLHYFNSSISMLNASGTPDSTIFIEDGLHMNEEGYKRWTTGIKPMLESIYQSVGEPASE